DAGFGGRVAGVSLILWGIHKLNYPFLRNVDAFAPIGFTLGSLLALGVGIGLLMAYLDQLQSRSRTSENRFRALVSSIEDLVMTADLDGRVVNVYGGWFERHGMPEEWLHARDVTDILDHRHDETVSNEIMRAGTGETRHITLDVELDGRLRWLAFTVSPLRDSHDTIASVVAVGRDVTDQEESRRMLAERLQENQTLLQEVHHRVKNNMQIMSSLLSLQSAQLKHPADRALIAESSRRIDTMAQVHEQLYSADSLSDIAMNPYVNDLAERLVQTYALDGRTVRLIVDVDEIQLPIDRAIPCAQLLHEVITNALKHGFREREQGTLHIVFRTDGESHVRLRVHDDGHGIKVCDGRPASMTTGTTTGTLGLKLVELLARQLDGVATFTNTYGTTFEISFPLEIPHA
ncbi:MAG: sensor histidine kinase, partial [Spirochaetota bacterium]